MSPLFQAIVETGDALLDLAADQAEWSQRQFGTDQQRGAVGPLRHLAKEAVEAQQAVIMNSGPGGDNGIIAEELADCLLLVLDASRRAGFKPIDLIKAAQQKMAINRSRKWSTPQPDAPVEHVRESQPAADRDPCHAQG